MENRTDHEPASAGSLLPAVMTGFWETDTTGQRAGTAAADNAEGAGYAAAESAPQHSASPAGNGWNEDGYDWARYGYKYVPEAMIRWQRHACDYIKDGVLVCGHCHTTKESVHYLQGRQRLATKVWCLCMCQAKEAFNKARLEKERRLLAEEYRKAALPVSAMRRWTFAWDDGSNPEAHARARLYVQQFARLKEKGMGILLLGPGGCGKTWLAAQIVNALCDRGCRCRFTSLTEILSDIGANREGRRDYIRKLCKHDLIVLDGFGTEFSAATPTADSILLELADALYETRTPVIVTSPLNYDLLLRNTANLSQSTAVCRILGRCCCLKLQGSSGISRAMEELAWAERLISVPAQKGDDCNG